MNTYTIARSKEHVPMSSVHRSLPMLRVPPFNATIYYVIMHVPSVCICEFMYVCIYDVCIPRYIMYLDYVFSILKYAHVCVHMYVLKIECAPQVSIIFFHETHVLNV